MTFASIVMSFPSERDTNAQDMNYTILVIGGWIVLCLIYYFFPINGARNWFKGPISNMSLRPDSETEGSKGSVGVEEKAAEIDGY